MHLADAIYAAAMKHGNAAYARPETLIELCGGNEWQALEAAIGLQKARDDLNAATSSPLNAPRQAG